MGTKDLLEQTETRQEKKTWVTPEILDSPVITVTEGDPDEVSGEAQNYS